MAALAEQQQLTQPAKLLLLASILTKSGVISNNGKAFLKVRAAAAALGVTDS